MSTHSVHLYQTEVEKIIHFGGTKKETAIRNAFYNLLNDIFLLHTTISVSHVIFS
jgi:hypothetical protein